MKKYLTTTILLLFGFCTFAQVPEGYYNSAIGKQGEELRTALFQIINNHTALDYSDLWNAYQYTDCMPSGKVWDIYSDVPDGNAAYYYTFNSDQCGSYSSEGDCYNREHSIPQSWFNEAMPMKTDLFHLYPTDGWVNNKRGNLPYGNVGSASWTSSNGSKVGGCSFPGCSGTVFEPIDAYKGDLARSYMYMTIRYKDKNLNQAASSVFNGSQLVDWAKSMFIEWHQLDPVSQKEIDRNNVIYNNFQHNRNPFIDCPELVSYLFGTHYDDPWYPTCVEWDPDAIEEYHLDAQQETKLFPNPAQSIINVESNYLSIQSVSICDMMGKELVSHKDLCGKRISVPIDGVPAGCYLVKVLTDKTAEIIKLIVQ